MFIWDFAADLVLGQIMDWIYAQIVGFLGEFFSMMGNMGAELFEMSWVQAVVLFFSYLAWALYVTGLVVSAFECAIEYQSGRGSVKDAALNAFKGFMAVELFTVVPVELYKLAITLQGSFTSGITGLANGGISAMTLAALANVGGFGFNPIMGLFCVILMGYAVIKVFFANLKRGGILLIQIAVGSLYMFSVPRGYIDGFVSWCKQVVGLCLTAFCSPPFSSRGHGVQQQHAFRPRPDAGGLGGAKDRGAIRAGHLHQGQSDEHRVRRPNSVQHDKDGGKGGGGEMTDKKLVYIASPYAGDIEYNTRMAIKYCRYAAEHGVIPLAPHLLMPRFLCKRIRKNGSWGSKWGCSSLPYARTWVFGGRISEGMRREIAEAERLGVPIKHIGEIEMTGVKDMKKYGIWAKRSAASVCGAAEAWLKSDGKPITFDTYEEAAAKAEALMKNIGTANVSYYPRPMEQEPEDAPAPSISMKL